LTLLVVGAGVVDMDNIINGIDCTKIHNFNKCKTLLKGNSCVAIVAAIIFGLKEQYKTTPELVQKQINRVKVRCG
jgi:hypothetical protein